MPTFISGLFSLLALSDPSGLPCSPASRPLLCMVVMTLVLAPLPPAWVTWTMEVVPVTWTILVEPGWPCTTLVWPGMKVTSVLPLEGKGLIGDKWIKSSMLSLTFGVLAGWFGRRFGL